MDRLLLQEGIFEVSKIRMNNVMCRHCPRLLAGSHYWSPCCVHQAVSSTLPAFAKRGDLLLVDEVTEKLLLYLASYDSYICYLGIVFLAP